MLSFLVPRSSLSKEFLHSNISGYAGYSGSNVDSSGNFGTEGMSENRQASHAEFHVAFCYSENPFVTIKQ